MQAEDEERQTVARMLEALERDGRFEPLSEEPGETAFWQSHEIASLVENRVGVPLDPLTMAAKDHAQWIVHATSEGKLEPPHSKYHRPYWIHEAGQRIGTLAVETSALGNTTLRVSSLYVRPAARGHGHGRRALSRAYDAAVEAGLDGIRFSTEWSWQPAVRAYLGLGAWIRGWKRSLDFTLRKDLAPFRVEIDGDSARFVVKSGGDERPWIVARRVGTRLEWLEQFPPGDEASFEAPGTFAVALAVRGFPLITTDAAWREQLELGFSDAGGPEGLAFKIQRFEAWDRKHGWITPAPRIPGLEYPDWAELVR